MLVIMNVPPEVATALEHLRSLYNEFNGERVNDFRVFRQVVPLVAPLPEPHLSAEIAHIQVAMSDYLPAAEVERRIRAGRSDKRISVERQASVLYDAASKHLEMYRDATDIAYARFEADDGHCELHPLTSTSMRDYLRRLALAEFDKTVVRNDVINSVRDQLHAIEAPIINPRRRIAERDGSFYYDMAGDQWTAIGITPTLWEPCYDPPPLFTRSHLQAEQVQPDRKSTTADITLLTNLLGIPGAGQELLTLVWLITTFIPAIKRPILYLYGEKGSGKTLLAKTLLELSDPTVTDPTQHEVKVLGQPSNRDAAVTQLANRHAVAYDNLYSIPPWLANLVSTRTTGSAEDKKRLYTNAESYLMTLTGPIILNGIHRHGLAYTDLQDRIMAIRLEPRAYTSETQYWERFTEIRPKVLGAIFTALSRAMKELPDVRRAHTPVSRFVDFELWGRAVTEALDEAGIGCTQDGFLRAYAANVQHVRYHVLEGHPIAQCLMYLRDQSMKKVWKGTPDQLLHLLNAVAPRCNVDTTQKSWPKSSQWLTRRLEDIRSNLEEVSISYSERKERTPSSKTPKRIITLTFS